MPKTKFQSFIFTLVMVFCMVYCMTCYTVSLQMGALRYSVFLISIQDMWIEYVVVFFLIFFVFTKLTQKIAHKVISFEKSEPIFMIIAIQSLTVCLVVPTITLFATFLHNGLTEQWFIQWIYTAVMCFPFAYCLQVFFVGPLVRCVFRIIFREDKCLT